MKDSTIDLTDDSFQMTMENFVIDEESNVVTTMQKFTEACDGVKEFTAYFYGEATAKDDSGAFKAFSASEDYSQLLKVFSVVREFLTILDRSCKDVMQPGAS